MSGFRDKGFSDRLSTAANARKAMLERVRDKPGADDPKGGAGAGSKLEPR